MPGIVARGGGLIVVFLLLAIIAWIALEIWAYIRIARLMNDFLWPIIIQVVISIIGFNRVKAHIGMIKAQAPDKESFQTGMFAAFMANRAGAHVVGIIGGVLMIIPGFITDVIGLLLVLPGLNRLAGKLGNLIIGAVVRASLAKMAGGGFPGAGFPGGFPGFPGGGGGIPGVPKGMGRFPGFAKPDDRRAYPPKIIDTKPEK